MVDESKERASGREEGKTVDWYIIVSRDEEQDIWDPRESIKVVISASLCRSVL
jgi:hypothetical protein